LGIDLTGRKAFVTGGARGIGASIVRTFAKAGALVAFTYLGSQRGVQAAEELVQELSGSGHPVCSYVAAGQDMMATRGAVEAAAVQMGGLDILVPNVGQNWIAALQDLELEAWQRALDVNLTSAYIAVKSALPWLTRAARADVVLIGSSGVLDGGGGGIHYAAAKAGLEGMMRALMREFPRRGVRVNIVHPCVVDTDLLRERYDTDDKRARLTEQVPVGRLGRPEDIASLVAYLCSDLGSFICGQSILVDGGRTLWRQV